MFYDSWSLILLLEPFLTNDVLYQLSYSGHNGSQNRMLGRRSPASNSIEVKSSARSDTRKPYRVIWKSETAAKYAAIIYFNSSL